VFSFKFFGKWITSTRKLRLKIVQNNCQVTKIKGDSGGKVNILGVDSIGHRERKRFTWPCV